jgi:hypothetical protein
MSDRASFDSPVLGQRSIGRGSVTFKLGDWRIAVWLTRRSGHTSSLVPEPSYYGKRAKQPCAGCKYGGYHGVPRAATGERERCESEGGENAGKKPRHFGSRNRCGKNNDNSHPKKPCCCFQQGCNDSMTCAVEGKRKQRESEGRENDGYE